MKHTEKYYLAVEGNIGAGKSTWTRMWAEKFNARSVYENFSANPYLPEFYKNPHALAFQLEISFLAERYAQLKSVTEEQDLFQPHIVSDYLFAKSFIFAKNNLNEGEFELFQKVFQIMHQILPMPNLIVYIHRDPLQLKKNIAKRGRAFEEAISTEYLTAIEKGYFDYFKTIQHIPILLIDAADADFEGDIDLFNRINKYIFETNHKPGMQTLSIQTLS